MKKYFLFGFLFVLFLQVTEAQFPDNRFILKGTIEEYDKGWIYIGYTNQKNNRIADSTMVSNGRFSFNGFINEPSMAYLYLKKAEREDNSVNFFIGPVTILINLKTNDFKNAKISGSKTQDEYAELTSAKQKVSKRWQVVMDTLTAVNNRSNFEYQELKNWVLFPYNA